MQLLRSNWQWTNVVRLPEIKTVELNTYRNLPSVTRPTSAFHVWAWERGYPQSSVYRIAGKFGGH